MGLEEIRQEIDKVDGRLKELFLQRLTLSAQVAEAKRRTGGPVYVEERELEVIASRSEGVDEELLPECREFFLHMMRIGRLYQYARLEEARVAQGKSEEGLGRAKKAVLRFPGGLSGDRLAVCLAAARMAGLMVERLSFADGKASEICLSGDFSKQLARAALLQITEENGDAQLEGVE